MTRAIAASRLATTTLAAAVDGATGAVLTRLPGGDGVAVCCAPTDALVAWAEALQHQLDEGPALDALRSGRPTHTDDLRCDDRWPALGPRVARTGLAACLSTPLLAGDRPLGALTVYAPAGVALGPRAGVLAGLVAELVVTVWSLADQQPARSTG